MNLLSNGRYKVCLSSQDSLLLMNMVLGLSPSLILFKPLYLLQVVHVVHAYILLGIKMLTIGYHLHLEPDWKMSCLHPSL